MAETSDLIIKSDNSDDSAGEDAIAGIETAKPVDEGGKYVTFKSGSEYYGLKIQYVNEIIVLQEITAVPESEEYIKGLINLRGKIIPVIDVRLRFKQEPFEYNDRTCIIVINVASTVVGLIVEKVAEVVEIHAEDIIPSPSIGHSDNSQNKYVYAIGKVGSSVKLLLDPDRLIRYNDIQLANAVDGEENGEAEGEMAAVKKADKNEEVSADKNGTMSEVTVSETKGVDKEGKKTATKKTSAKAVKNNNDTEGEAK